MSYRIEESRTFPSAREEKENFFPSIEEAAELAFSIFELPQIDASVPEATQKLLEEETLFPGMASMTLPILKAKEDKPPGQFFWKRPDGFHEKRVASTRGRGPNTPVVKKKDVDGANLVVALTYGHHLLSTGPQKDLVFAFGEAGETKAYSYPKQTRFLEEVSLQEISSLEEVEGLVNHQPRRGVGPRISCLMASPNDEHYRLVAAFCSPKLSFSRLLERIRLEQSQIEGNQKQKQAIGWP